MKKTILIMTAAAIIGAVALKPTPASAIPGLMPLILMSKEDKKFKAVNPYAKKAVKAKKGKKGMKAKKAKKG